MEHQMQMYMFMLENQQYMGKSPNSKHFGNVYPANQTDAQMTAGQTAKSNGKSKICLVCGDVSKSNHFGALCCCSCKAFFRRSVQNESYKTFHCPYNSNCEITILSRKCCQFCRFEKCVSIGMEISWVMSEEERLQLLKSRMLKKQKKEQEQAAQSSSHSSSSKDSFMDSSSQNSDSHQTDSKEPGYFADYSRINNYLSGSETNQIECLVNDYLRCCIQIRPKFVQGSSFVPTDEDELRLAENDEEIIQLFLNTVYQFANFAKKHLPIFPLLKLSDQQILLRSSIIELCFLRAAFCYEQGMFYRTILIRGSRFSSNKEQSSDGRSINHPNRISFDYQNCVPFSQNDQFSRQNNDSLCNPTDRPLSHPNDKPFGHPNLKPPDHLNGVHHLPTSSVQFANSNGIHLPDVQEKPSNGNPLEYRFGKASILTRERLEHFLGEQLSNKFFSFVKQIQECHLDEVMVLLVALIVLLNPERNPLIDCKHITAEQESYLDLLERYMQWKFGSALSGTLFAKLLINLTNLRELGELFAEFQLENHVLDRFDGRLEPTDREQTDRAAVDCGRLLDRLPRMFTIKSLTD